MSQASTPLYCIDCNERPGSTKPSATSFQGDRPAGEGSNHPLSTEALRALSDLRFAVKQFDDQTAAVEILRSAAGILATLAVERQSKK